MDEVAALVRELLEESARAASRFERRRAQRVARLAASEADLSFAIALTDQVARTLVPERAMRQLEEALPGGSMPGFLGPLDKLALRVGLGLGPVAPGVLTALVRRRIRREVQNVVLVGGNRVLKRYLARREAEGIEVNVNVVGEAILGDAEAERRREQILALLEHPEVAYVSVKASAVAPRLSSYAFDHSVSRIVEGLRPIYLAAARRDPQAFVTLDMEEYRDLHLTLSAFEQLLADPELAGLDAGVVLQAYLPDSHAALEELGNWALERYRKWGAKTKVRVVKGANLGMEKVEAELHGWEPAPYATKAEVDASAKLLLRRALDPRWGGALEVALGSHNLFDVAWALLSARSVGAADLLDIEMLQGMAPGQPQALARRALRVRLYAPIVRAGELDSAAAYLVRRLDEGSAPGNWLAHHFSLVGGAGSSNRSRSLDAFEDAFEAEKARFGASLRLAPDLSTQPRRHHERAQQHSRPSGTSVFAPFSNAADTDWTSRSNREWVQRELLSSRHGPPPARVVPDTTQVDRVVAASVSGRQGWVGLPVVERARLLLDAADLIEQRRAELIAAMVHETAKVVPEADVEVSEAVDFARYSAHLALQLDAYACDHEPLGTVVVCPPWNFPLSILLGGAFGGLAAGNAVIVKPAPQAVLVGWEAVSCLWDAGIPRSALGFLACPDGEVGRHLVTHPDVDAVLLTGSWSTAQAFLSWHPEMNLMAETSGKNAVVVTACADLDQAVGDLVRSAFGHSGQKCSAASLAIVEQPVMSSSRFLRRLADATRTLVVGEAQDPATEVGPLIGPAEGDLLRGLTRLDPGERWLVRPRQVGPRLWTPGIRTGVRLGSWFYRTECFGPVLGVLSAPDLDAAIEIQNGTGYGLTGGLFSLDHGEIRRWLEKVEVGNAYVNRPITGAVVGRQPFGGWKRSSVGAGAKLGGPGMLLHLVRWVDSHRDAHERIGAARRFYESAWEELSSGIEMGQLRSEQNLLISRPLRRVMLYTGPQADPHDEALCHLAADCAGVELEVFEDAKVLEDHLASASGGDGAELPETLRVLGSLRRSTLVAAHRAGVVVDRRRPVSDGRIELRRWSREQALSICTHRYGRIVSSPLVGPGAGRSPSSGAGRRSWRRARSSAAVTRR